MLPKELNPLEPFLRPLQHLRDQINRLPDKIIHLTESIKQLFIRPDISQRIKKQPQSLNRYPPSLTLNPSVTRLFISPLIPTCLRRPRSC